MTQVVDNPVAEQENVAPASRSEDNPKIVEAIQAHLDAFESAGTTASETATETPVAASEAKPTAEEVVSEDEKPSTDVEETPTKEAAVAQTPASSTLPPAAYVRTAKARGWTDAEITEAMAVNPEAALRTFERMHASRTQEISEWADLGRQIRQTGPVAQPVSGSFSAPTPQPVPTAVATSLQPINVDEMVEKFGNEELIRALAGPINAAIATVAPLMTQATESQAEAKRTQAEALGKIVEDFFTAPDMVPFTKIYGKVATLTPAQIVSRQKMLETADALIAGAAYQGRRLSIPDALLMAHDSVSSDMKETIIRDQIRSKVAKRATNITLRPTAQGRAVLGGPPRDRQDLLNRTEDRLAAAFQ